MSALDPVQHRRIKGKRVARTLSFRLELSSTRVRRGETITVQVVQCAGSPARCTPTLDPRVSVERWLVQARAGGEDIHGRIEPHGSAAFYTAPAKRPVPARVVIAAILETTSSAVGTVEDPAAEVVILAPDLTGTMQLQSTWGAMDCEPIRAEGLVNADVDSDDGNITVYNLTGTFQLKTPEVTCGDFRCTSPITDFAVIHAPGFAELLQWRPLSVNFPFVEDWEWSCVQTSTGATVPMHNGVLYPGCGISVLPIADPDSPGGTFHETCQENSFDLNFDFRPK